MTKTKNERITILENEVAELKLIVHELRGKKSIEPSTTFTVEDKPLTPNQQRAAIIEKAKAFIQYKKVERRNMEVYINRKTLNWVNAEFIVNEKKKTVVCLIRWTKDKSLDGRGVAKCNPNDVFNEHIGKAIALGRALGLDVSEFEQAVQPTEFAVGQVITFQSDLAGEDKGGNFKIKSIEDSTLWLDDDFDGYDLCDEDWKPKILNDTNVIYEV